LVPLDGSELAVSILPAVVDLAKCMNAVVTLLHVCYFPVATDAVAVRGQEEGAERETLKECDSFLEKSEKEMLKHGLSVTHQCVEGVPAREIIAYAHTNGFDLIAMATHGRGEVAWVLGSTAEKVVTHATVPTLLYRVVKTKPPMLKEASIGLP
jgi:nucleotide-binding universal stress UspA family protein